MIAVQDLGGADASSLPYDALVLATGAAPVQPPIPGLDQPGVFVLRELTDGQALKQHLAEVSARAGGDRGGRVHR